MAQVRPVLENDNRFLRFLIDTMAQRMTASMHIRSDMATAEKALIGYLRWRCPNHSIANVSEAAFQMNYSRRQIQRALKSLTDQGRIVRAGKGRYFLKEE